MRARILHTVMAVTAVVYLATCVAGQVLASAASDPQNLAELWKQPNDLATRDLYNGPWGRARAPDPESASTSTPL